MIMIKMAQVWLYPRKLGMQKSSELQKKVYWWNTALSLELQRVYITLIILFVYM